MDAAPLPQRRRLVAMFPPVPAAMIDAGYADFARRWNPILDVFDAGGVRFAHAVHPGEIAYDFWTTSRALEAASSVERTSSITGAGTGAVPTSAGPRSAKLAGTAS